MPNAGHEKSSWNSPMRRAALAVGLLVGGASCAKPQAASTAEIDALAATRDTVALARLAERECADTSASAARQTCYEDYFVKLARSDRVHVALGALAALAAAHPDIQRDGHGYTHVIGIRAWHPGADVAAIFRSCTGLFQSGLLSRRDPGVPDGRRVGRFDAVGEAVRRDRAERGRSLAPVPVRPRPGPWFRDGVELGAAARAQGLRLAAQRLGPVLVLRRRVHGERRRVDARRTSHTAAHALSATMPMSDSAMAGDGARSSGSPDPRKITFKMRDSADALYPCSIVDTMYQFSCYQLQGGLILTGRRATSPRPPPSVTRRRRSADRSAT